MQEGSLRSLIASRLAARLRIDPGEVDVRERFNRLGLDSAGATALIAELSAELSRTLSPTLVWAHPSVEELARYLSGGADSMARSAPAAAVSRTSEPIAIVGMACRFPLSPDPEAFWRLLRDGVDATRTVPPDRWDADALYDPDPQAPGTINTRRGAFLDRVDRFDPLFFGISPREAREMDPQQRLALELAWEALEDAGIPPRSLAGSRAGVFMGVIFRDYADLHREADAPVTSHTGPGSSLAIVANRISYLFGLRGPSLSVDTACSSSLVSVHLACQSLRDGECALALAGGVNLILYPGIAVELTKFGGLSGDGRCKAFDARADGFARGEGAGMVVLKPLSRALADGDPVYALIRGGAVNNDGSSNGLTAPSPQAQVEVLADACARAGVEPRRVQYVETHGTGTPLGDPIEARALAAVLGPGRDPERPLVIGSAKTNIAHQEGSAGIAGLIKLALAIHHRQIPPSLHFETPNPDIPFEELGLRVQTELGPWPAGPGEPVLAGVSSFGWGGTNAHLVLEGFPAPAPVEVADGAGARAVFVFSGLGSQWPGMGRDLLRSEPLVRARLERCDRALRPLTGWSLIEELISGNRWADIEVALPCLAALGIAVADLWRSWGIEPSAVVGHSSGEIPAAYTAGVLTLDEAMRVSVHYSRALGKIQGPGGMGVVGLPPEEAAERIAAQGRDLTVTGHLSPVSTAVAGDAAEVDAFLFRVTAEGAFAARVALLAVAAHTPQVLPHQAALREALADLQPLPPAVPLLSTVTGEPLERPMDADYWADNLFRPVLFSQAVARLLARGERAFLEVDAHPILATPLEQGFAAAGVTSGGARVLPSLRRDEAARDVLSRSLAALGGARERAERPEVIPLSARSPEALRDLARETARVDEGSLGDLAWTAAVRRSHHEHRLAVVARTRAELAERLEAFARGEAAAGVVSGRRARGETGGLVFVFSGQGPQWPGMGRQLFEAEPVFRRVVERCDEALQPLLGYSFRARMEAEEDALSHTEVAQTAIYALQAGLLALWREWGVSPDAVVGHSVGEVAAAHASGALSLEEGAIVAACRGRAMEPARGLGAMAALELPAAEVEPLLDGLDVSVAAVNSPSATTVAGSPEALDELVRRLDRLGLTCRRLRVEYAFHTAQMDPCVRELLPLLAELRPRAATTPMVSSVTGGPVTGPDLDAAYWCANVRQPVRFAQAVERLGGSSLFLEVSPHPVLSVAVTQTVEAGVLASLRRGRDERETLLEALGSLWVLGQPVDWLGVHPGGGRQVRLPTYPFQRQRYWFEGRGFEGRTPVPAPDPAAAVVVTPVVQLPVAQADDLFAERLLAEQLDAFNRMVALQLDALGRGEI
ncbi:MAG: acyltransferase domain-containing protein [Acidobacteriota bacterium]